MFREVIEAGLIIGIVLAMTRGVPGRGQWVAGGAIAAVLGAAMLAIFAQSIADAFEGSGQEMFNASVLGIAVLMLMWHNAWMASHGQEMASSMAAVGKAVSSGSGHWRRLPSWLGLPRCARAPKSSSFSTELSPPARRHPRC